MNKKIFLLIILITNIHALIQAKPVQSLTENYYHDPAVCKKMNKNNKSNNKSIDDL